MDFLFDTILYIAVPTLLLVIQRQASRIENLSVKASTLNAKVNQPHQPSQDKLDKLELAFSAYEELFDVPTDDEDVLEDPLVSLEVIAPVQETKPVPTPSEDYWHTVEVREEDIVITEVKSSSAVPVNNIVQFLPVTKQPLPLLLAPAPSLPTANAGCAVLNLNQLSVRELRSMCKGEDKYKGYSKYAKKGKKALVKFMQSAT